jgi:hypothetical protein
MKVEEALCQLSVGNKAKRLQLLWPLIEAKLAEGVSHAAMLDLLNRNGFGLTERTYKSYLYRHRKKQRAREQDGEAKTSKKETQVLSGLATSPAFSADAPKRPATFDYDPRGIPDLLK